MNLIQVLKSACVKSRETNYFFVNLFFNFYKIFINPFLGKSCRHYPSCSAYARHVLLTERFLLALYLICKRLLLCNPFSSPSYDFNFEEIK